MGEFRKIVTKAGEVLDYELEFEENTRLRTGVPEKMGTVERYDYSTSVYENGVTYNKTAYVYLPYCYDKDDKDRTYHQTAQIFEMISNYLQEGTLDQYAVTHLMKLMQVQTQ